MHGESLGIWLHGTSPNLPAPEIVTGTNEDFEPNCTCMAHDTRTPDHNNVTHGHQTTITWPMGTRPQYPWKHDAWALAYNILRNVMHGHQTTVSLETWRMGTRPQYPWKHDARAPDHSIIGNVMHWHQTTVSLETWHMGTRPQYPWKHDARTPAYNILRNVMTTVSLETWCTAWDSHDACSVWPVAHCSTALSN